MKSEYVITNEELQTRGVDLNDYALEGTLIPAIINNALDIAVSRICFLDDSKCGEEDIELNDEMKESLNKSRKVKE